MIAGCCRAVFHACAATGTLVLRIGAGAGGAGGLRPERLSSDLASTPLPMSKANFNGRPVAAASSVLVLGTSRTEFMLCPPRRTLAFDTPRCLLWVPFGSTTLDLNVAGQRRIRARVRAGAAWFFGPGTPVHAGVDEPVEWLVLAVDPYRLHEIADRIAEGRRWGMPEVLNLADPGIDGVARELRRTMLDERLPPETYLQALVDAILARLACHLTQALRDARRSDAIAPNRLDRVLRHIDEHLDTPLRVAQLAQMAGLSRSHFSRAFQHMTGHAPQRFIVGRRLSRARALLLSGHDRLAQIASQAGFSSHAHMTAVFRKELGVTPSRYRSVYAAGAPAGHDADPAAAAGAGARLAGRGAR